MPRTLLCVQTMSVSVRSTVVCHTAILIVHTELPFEIGAGLLTEVQQLQSLLAEHDKTIQDMKEEKDDLDKIIEALQTGLWAQEQSAGEV